MKGHNCSFSLRGAPPRADPTAHRSPNAAMGSASGTPPSSSRIHTAGPVRSPAHTGEMGVLSTIWREACSACGRLSTCIFVRREASREAPWQWHCNSCGMRMDHACRQAGNAMLVYLKVEKGCGEAGSSCAPVHHSLDVGRRRWRPVLDQLGNMHCRF